MITRLLLIAATFALAGCVEGQCNFWWDSACYQHTVQRSPVVYDPTPKLAPDDPRNHTFDNDWINAHPTPVVVEKMPGRLVCRNEPKYAWSDDVDGPMPVVRRCYIVQTPQR